MCGIAGIVAPQARRFSQELERMTSALRHRGPDGVDAHHFDNCALVLSLWLESHDVRI